MVKYQEVSTFSDFEKVIDEEAKSSERVYVLFFAGSRTEESWCPDCRKAKPVIEEVINKKAPKNATLIHVDVGDKASWKSPDCEFRTNNLIKVTNVPTLLRWDTKKLLTEEACADLSQLENIL